MLFSEYVSVILTVYKDDSIYKIASVNILRFSVSVASHPLLLCFELMGHCSLDDLQHLTSFSLLYSYTSGLVLNICLGFVINVITSTL